MLSSVPDGVTHIVVGVGAVSVLESLHLVVGSSLSQGFNIMGVLKPHGAREQECMTGFEKPWWGGEAGFYCIQAHLAQ